MSLNHIVRSNDTLDLLSVHFKNLESDELDVICGDNSTLIIKPPTNGNLNQVLVSDGNGGLLWTTLSGGVGISFTGSPPSVGQHLRAFDTSGTFYQNSDLIENKVDFDFGNKTIKTNANVMCQNNICGNLNTLSIISETSNINFDNTTLNNINELNSKNLNITNNDLSIISYKLPSQGNDNQVLSSNGNGTLKWQSIPSFSGITHTGINPIIGQYAIYDTTSGNSVSNSRLKETSFDLNLDGLNIINNNTLNTNNLIQKNTDNTTLNFKLPSVGQDLQYISSDGLGNVKWQTLPDNKTVVDFLDTSPAIVNGLCKYYDTLGNIKNSSIIETGGNVDFGNQNLTNISTTNTNNLNVNSIAFSSTIPADIKTLQDKTQNITSYSVNNTTFQGTIYGKFDSGGTINQYVSGTGDLVSPSNSQQSNIYQYRTQVNSGIPPPTNGRILYGTTQSLIVGSSNTLYISHLTDNGVDIENFLYNISLSNQIYIQDTTISGDYQIWNVSGNITIVSGSYIQVPVSLSSGTHIFVNNHQIIMAVLLNTNNIDTRLSLLEDKTVNQTGASLSTTFNGNLTGSSIINSTYSGSNYFLKSNGTVDTNTYALNSALSNYLTTASASATYATITNLNNINLSSEGLGTYSLIGSTSTNPTFKVKSISAGSNITITDNSNILTINSTGGSVMSSGYPFNPIQFATTTVGSGSKQYWYICLMSQATSISGIQVLLSGGGSDNFRCGIYRGYLKTGTSTTITLVGQTTNTTVLPGLPYNRKTITAEIGQNLNFSVGEYMTIAFHNNGSTNVYYQNGPISSGLFTDIAYTTSANYAIAGFPATLTQSSVLSTLATKLCFELY